MKKGKLLVLGLIALMLAGGLALASCGEESNCPGGATVKAGSCSPADNGYHSECSNVCITNGAKSCNCN